MYGALHALAILLHLRTPSRAVREAEHAAMQLHRAPHSAPTSRRVSPPSPIEPREPRERRVAASFGSPAAPTSA
jgi:hypothetical protein